MKKLYLYPGQWASLKEPGVIKTILGSCVGVALYDYRMKLGGLNHFLLPNLPSGENPSTRYGDIAISTLIEATLGNGASKKFLQAKVYGGANVLDGVQIGVGIGNRNVETAFRLLEENHIPILESDTGGNTGRIIEMNTQTFEVKCRQEGEEGKPVDITGFGHLKAVKNVKVVVVDDSLTVRSIFQKIFRQQGIDVVGTAADPFEAREVIVRTKPDVITLDIEMPKMNGIAFLEKLMKHMPMPVVMVSSLGSQGEAALRALELGAVEFIQKPSQYDPQLLRQLGELLAEKVKAASIRRCQ